MTPSAGPGTARLATMTVEECRSHPGVRAIEACRGCGQRRCAECLIAADELVLPICRPCADAVVPATDGRVTTEETVRFSPRTVDGWVVVHEPGR